MCGAPFVVNLTMNDSKMKEISTDTVKHTLKQGRDKARRLLVFSLRFCCCFSFVYFTSKREFRQNTRCEPVHMRCPSYINHRWFRADIISHLSQPAHSGLQRRHCRRRACIQSRYIIGFGLLPHKHTSVRAAPTSFQNRTYFTESANNSRLNTRAHACMQAGLV